MQIETAWVNPPPQVSGLDHLAVQAPCINIYGRMLPGITNVTDRARYYSFYPWLIWALDQEGHRKYDDDFIERFRRADCLFCLIAQRHAATSDGPPDEHAAAMVGSQKLAGAARSVDEGPLRLSDYSLLKGAIARYFANTLGGLGQYYIGVLRELAVLDGDASRGIRYTREIGEVIARRMDEGVDRALFMQVVDADRVTGAELDALHEFCPCRLTANQSEQQVLGELFFARGSFHDSETLPRRRTLQSILQLSALLSAQGEEISETLFRACVYTGTLPDGSSWPVLSNLVGNRQKWQVYARNELLSVAVQGLFFAVLDAYGASMMRLETSAEIVDWYLEQPEVLAALSEVGAGTTFSSCVADSGSWLPSLSAWQEKLHEVQLTETIARDSSSAGIVEKRQAVVAAALRTLIALASRRPPAGTEYADIVFDPGYFQYYPINLKSFAARAEDRWADLTMRDLLHWLLVNWGLEVHLRVALRKLRGQSQSTFRVRPSDRGMEVIAVPPAVHTRPRLNQAVRVLKDIGALELASSGGLQPTTFGLAMMELGDAP